MIKLMLGLLVFANGTIQAMRVAPDITETAAQKGARFKKECADAARLELARKQEHMDRATLGNPDLSDEEAAQIARNETVVQCKSRIKNILQTIFPTAPVLRTPVALNTWLEKESNRYIKQAEEDLLNARNKGLFSCFTAWCD